MPDYLAIKKDKVIHLAVSLDNPYLIKTGDELCESNYPFRVFETEFGKVIIVSSSSLSANQVILSRTDLFPKRKKHIDYDFVVHTYYEKIKQIIHDDPLCGTEEQTIYILIIAEGKIFEINDSLIREVASTASFYRLLAAYMAVNDNSPESSGHKLVCDAWKYYSSFQGENNYPLAYINTSSFVPEIIKGDNL